MMESFCRAYIIVHGLHVAVFFVGFEHTVETDLQVDC